MDDNTLQAIIFIAIFGPMFSYYIIKQVSLNKRFTNKEYKKIILSYAPTFNDYDDNALFKIGYSYFRLADTNSTYMEKADNIFNEIMGLWFSLSTSSPLILSPIFLSMTNYHRNDIDKAFKCIDSYFKRLHIYLPDSMTASEISSYIYEHDLEEILAMSMCNGEKSESKLKSIYVMYEALYKHIYNKTASTVKVTEYINDTAVISIMSSNTKERIKDIFYEYVNWHSHYNSNSNSNYINDKHDDFERNYDFMGLKYTTSMNEVNSKYKSLIKEWHPDLYSNDSIKQAKALEITKLLNEARSEIMSHIRSLNSNT